MLTYHDIGTLVVDLVCCVIVAAGIYAGCSVQERLWKKTGTPYRLCQLAGFIVGGLILLVTGYLRVVLFS